MKYVVAHRKKKSKVVLGKSKHKATSKQGALFAARKEFVEKHPQGSDKGAEAIKELTFSVQK